MSRNLNGKRGRDKDQTESRIRKMHYENNSLKRKVGQLRKMIDQIETGWCPGCLRALEKGEHEGAPEPEQVTIPVKKENDRTCHQCQDGKLEIVKYYKLGEAYYFRKCNNPHCKNRTRGKKWTAEVQD